MPLQVLTSDELAGSLRRLKPTAMLAKDRCVQFVELLTLELLPDKAGAKSVLWQGGDKRPADGLRLRGGCSVQLHFFHICVVCFPLGPACCYRNPCSTFCLPPLFCAASRACRRFLSFVLHGDLQPLGLPSLCCAGSRACRSAR